MKISLMVKLVALCYYNILKVTVWWKDQLKQGLGEKQLLLSFWSHSALRVFIVSKIYYSLSKCSFNSKWILLKMIFKIIITLLLFTSTDAIHRWEWYNVILFFSFCHIFIYLGLCCIEQCMCGNNGWFRNAWGGGLSSLTLDN